MKHKKKHPAQHHALTSFYTAEQERQIKSEELDVAMFHTLKKLRKNSR